MRLKTSQLPNTQQIIAARELKSGDISLQTASVEAREALEKEGTWLKSLADSTRILRQSFPLLVHGVCIAAVDTTNQEASIKEIVRKNQILHSGLEIMKISWPKWATKEKIAGVPKRYSSLLIEVATPEMGNRILEEGLLEGGQLKSCTRYNREGELVQCFKCQRYGHMTMNCNNSAKCGKCAGEHNTRDHKDSHGDKENCTVCGKAGHPAWSSKCSIRRQKTQGAQQKRASQDIKFSTGKRIERIADRGDGFTIIQGTNKRRAVESITNSAGARPRIGRPPNSTKLLAREANQTGITIDSFTKAGTSPDPVSLSGTEIANARSQVASEVEL